MLGIRPLYPRNNRALQKVGGGATAMNVAGAGRSALWSNIRRHSRTAFPILGCREPPENGAKNKPFKDAWNLVLLAGPPPRLAVSAPAGSA